MDWSRLDVVVVGHAVMELTHVDRSMAVVDLAASISRRHRSRQPS